MENELETADSAKREPATTVSDTSAAAASTHVQTRLSHLLHNYWPHVWKSTDASQLWLSTATR